MNMEKKSGMVDLAPRASRDKRFINWAVDFLFAVFGGFFLILTVFGGLIWDLLGIDIWGDVLGTIILLGWWFLYYFILEATYGKTLGKFITGTKVVTPEGEKASTWTIALRTLYRFVPFEALSGFWISDIKDCWHDEWSVTVVVLDR